MVWASILVLLTSTLAFSQQPEWKQTAVNDPLRGVAFEQFTLEGRFLVPPQHSQMTAPALVVQCQPGKHRTTNGLFMAGWIATGAVLNSVVQRNAAIRIPVEYRLDDKKLQSDFWQRSRDTTAIMLNDNGFLTNDCNINTLLYGHCAKHKRGKGDPVRKVLIGVPEYLGSEIEMEFEMPDPEQVADACGLIWKK